MASPEEKPQLLVVANDGKAPLEIMVELTADRYVLQPGDRMEIEAVLRGAPFHINFYDGGLQIYPGNADDHVARINGTVTDSWT